MRREGMMWHFDKDAKMGWVIVLDTPLSFVLNGREYTIPAGFRSDGCSISRIFWSIISPAIDYITLIPSIIHDWLYTEHICTRAEADAFYRRELVKRGMSALKALLVYCALRLFGWKHW